MIKMTPISWCVTALVLIGALVVTVAAFNREQPLTIADLPPNMPKLPDLAKEGSQNWKEITYERNETRVINGQSFDLVINSTLRNLGNSIVLRSDNWYPKNGGAALIAEDRYLLWANLFSLTYRYREPAPGYHAIFENQGWIQAVTTEFSAQFMGSDPRNPEWKLSAKTVREAETEVGSKKKETTTRMIDCMSVISSKVKNTVRCVFETSQGEKTESQSIYAPHVGLFFRLESNSQLADNQTIDSKPVNKIRVDGVALQL
jgi:hypothetical protein